MERDALVTLADVLARGYLPKELPLGFTSESFAAAVATSAPPEFYRGLKPRQSCRHALARPGMLVRTLMMPDPVHFFRLASLVADNYLDLKRRIDVSPFSLTKPAEDTLGIRAWVPEEPQSRSTARARHSARARYRVRVDVSQWYPSMYTHALDWAVRGKAVAKAAPHATTGLGPLLDIHTRNGQGKQSVGIPIGPDTSLVLGELVLSQVDSDLNLALRRHAHGFRYYDDYELFTASRVHADEAVTKLAGLLAEWQLALNPHKVAIDELPVPVEEEWVSILKRLRLDSHTSRERSDLNALFDEATRLSRRYPRDSVLAYAIGRFVTRNDEERHKVNKVNWAHLQNLLLQAALSEPGVLSRIGPILGWARDRGWRTDLATLGAAINLLIESGSKLGHNSEVAWGLWIAGQLGLRVRTSTSRAVSRVADDIVAIVALDLRDKGLTTGLDDSLWRTFMRSEGLLGEHWLLAYEACVHGWLPSFDGSDYIGGDPAFSHLRASQVRFYDEMRSLPSVGRRPSPHSRVAYLARLGSDDSSQAEWVHYAK